MQLIVVDSEEGAPKSPSHQALRHARDGLHSHKVQNPLSITAKKTAIVINSQRTSVSWVVASSLSLLEWSRSACGGGSRYPRFAPYRLVDQPPPPLFDLFGNGKLYPPSPSGLAVDRILLRVG